MSIYSEPVAEVKSVNFKDDAKAVLTKEEAAAKSFWLQHRAAIILSVASLIAGFLLGRW